MGLVSATINKNFLCQCSTSAWTLGLISPSPKKATLLLIINKWSPSDHIPLWVGSSDSSLVFLSRLWSILGSWLMRHDEWAMTRLSNWSHSWSSCSWSPWLSVSLSSFQPSNGIWCWSSCFYRHKLRHPLSHGSLQILLLEISKVSLQHTNYLSFFFSF